MEALKAGYGWSDLELYENYCYKLQMRYALGYDRLGDGDFEIRTLYYFRERLSRYNAEQGINLRKMPIFDPLIHHRRSVRLKDYNYSQNGAYFVTIVSQHRACLFGEVINGEMILNEIGRIVQAVWKEIPQNFSNVGVDSFVVMPNHIHGIIIMDAPICASHGRARQFGTTHIQYVGARHIVPLWYAVPLQHGSIERFGKPVPGSIPTIIRSFKSAVTNHMNELPRRKRTGYQIRTNLAAVHEVGHIHSISALFLQITFDYFFRTS